ncbi:glycosyltransferase [Simiduia aestuariiviva]|uniref:GT2 family glycosyltransferase/glycosyltransferase involved in cell wall biosynthesis/FtsZ-binding cell division protein ZapB n=1 Tax=Simiduia aestuariiviva TaxID=1510459 RepID=A0A839UPB2_9GAMM|nr:glycosyltransferase [Simiduia aestuariiviva]MBB3168370.1 GT2 family glycosyltransferase/glycosyltransferase involved in cell wall biosynthesis/FtsZ-binding cell division protein ZapB [Simiduia aestuariiviva]
MLFVVGMHRSGTSFAANWLRDIGLNFGEDSMLLEPQADNADGFVEHKNVVDLNDRLLGFHNQSWFRPNGNVELSAAEQEKIIELRASLEKAGVEAIKDPRLSLLIPYWVRKGDQLVVCLRDPGEVAASLLRRDHFPIEVSVSLWLIYNHFIAKQLKNREHEIFWFSELERKADSIADGVSNLVQRSLTSVMTALNNRFKPAMATSRSGGNQKISDPIYILAREVYRKCVEANSITPFLDVKLGGAIELVDTFYSLIAESRALRELKPKHLSLKNHADGLQAALDVRNKEFELLASAHNEELKNSELAQAKFKSMEAEFRAENQRLNAGVQELRAGNDTLRDENKLLRDENHLLQAEYSSLVELLAKPIGRLLYNFFRLYKLFTFRKGVETVFDRIFYHAEQQRKHNRKQLDVPEKLHAAMRVIEFLLKNPGIASRNLTWRNVRIFARRFGSNQSDFKQWLDARIPETIGVREVYIEKFDWSERIKFPVAPTPKVSIIVPVYNQVEITLSLLKSLVKYTSGQYEVILADDCSTDRTQEIQNYVENIIHIRNSENLGFLLNCNNAAQHAKGKIVVFLNNDTNVTEGWLNSIVDCFEDSTVGVVGPKILFANGQLQEAGGIIWKDGSGWNYGRMKDPEAPEYNYFKDVDYVSGCCLAVRTDIWNEIGGFDQRYVPAYYEDTDICFEARRLGYRVVYQPRSVVVHLEGASHGTDTNTGIKKYQLVNQEKFVQKWRSVLDSHFENGVDVFHARDRSATKLTMLFIDHYVPHYDKDAGSRAVFMYLQIMIDMGFNIKFIGDNFYKHEPYTSKLQSMGVEVLYGNFYAANIESWIDSNASCIDAAFVNRPHIAERYVNQIKKLGIMLIYFGHDLHFLRLGRQALHEKSKYLKKEADDWERRELAVIDQADIVYYPSSVEVDLLVEKYGINSAKVLPLFAYSHAQVDYQAGSRKGSIFVGGFGHPPNVDAVEWLYSEVFPKLGEEALPIYIVGSNVPDHIRQMNDSNFQVLGFLSDEELHNIYKQVRSALVPLRFGAGVKGKLLEAMYFGLPVVSTSIGLEGLGGLDRMYAYDSADEFANRVRELASDTDVASKASSFSLSYVNSNFSKGSLRDIFEKDIVQSWLNLNG